MVGSKVRLAWCSMAALTAIVACPSAMAQVNAAAGNQAATAPNMGMGMNMGMDMGMGMGFMPIPYGMFGSASLSPTDAAALGMNRSSAAGAQAMGMGNNVFANPMAAPMVYGGPYPLSPRQTGLMMLAGQSQMTGIGSGQLSGTRPGPAGSTTGHRPQQASAKPRGSAQIPGGLAARYFHRSAPVTRYPQSYYSRQSRYYPSITR